MIKRSQNKKRFSPINYKQRWFVLTRRHLIYYDSEGEVSHFLGYGVGCCCCICLHKICLVHILVTVCDTALRMWFVFEHVFHSLWPLHESDDNQGKCWHGMCRWLVGNCMCSLSLQLSWCGALLQHIIWVYLSLCFCCLITFQSYFKIHTIFFHWTRTLMRA